MRLASCMRPRTVAMSLFVSFGVIDVASAPAGPVSMAGQRITIVVGSPAGGGYDIYARLVGRHLGSMLPGNPGVVVDDMPGAGSLIAANWLANSAPRDGTAIAILPNPTLFEPLFGDVNAHFDMRKMNWLGSLNGETPVAAVLSKTSFISANDLLQREALIGASGSASDESRLPRLLNSLIHTKFKVVDGYPGTAGVALAMERGEVQGVVGDGLDSIKATKGDWLRDKKIRILLQITLTRDSELPAVPTALELASPENRDVLALLISRFKFGRLFMAPPGVPAPIVSTLQQGFRQMVDDVDFKRDVERSNLTIQFSSAEEVAATQNKFFASPQSVIDRASVELRKLDPH
jgi:tripartite-type tricarboxylate transporter receptor subunit TctC